MEHIILESLNIVMKRIRNYSLQSKHCNDGHSVAFWDLKLKQALALKARIETRFKVRHNILLVDFDTKRRVA